MKPFHKIGIAGVLAIVIVAALTWPGPNQASSPLFTVDPPAPRTSMSVDSPSALKEREEERETREARKYPDERSWVVAHLQESLGHSPNREEVEDEISFREDRRQFTFERELTENQPLDDE